MKKVSEIAKLYGVSDQAVRKWLKDGLKFDVLKEIGYKSYVVINTDDVDLYHSNKANKRKREV